MRPRAGLLCAAFIALASCGDDTSGTTDGAAVDAPRTVDARVPDGPPADAALPDAPAPDAPVDAAPDAAVDAAIDGPPPDAGCSTMGPLRPFAVADQSGIGTRAWTSTDNARISDNLYAEVTAMVPGEESHYLVATGFGFAVPAGATIYGIGAYVERSSLSGEGIIDDHVQIVKGGLVQAQDKFAAGIWGQIDAVVTYGGASDLWGQTWTPADINASDFGVALAARYASTSGNDWPRVDEIRIQVYYCP